MWSHRPSFTIALTGISRALIVRDRILGWSGPNWSGPDWTGPGWRRTSAVVSASRHSIPSGASILDAIYVEPVGPPARAAVLLCHGIGETVRPWFPVQQLLAINGVASLLFDYSGYGKSTGTIDWTQFEQDAVAAFRCLEGLAHPLPLSVLGFSLGSGVAAAVINQINAQRLILCAAFTSFRDATHAIGIPARLGPLVPPIWSAEESLRHCALPILIVHGERDRLFPVKMAVKLASLCGPNAKLVIVPEVGHNRPFRKPELNFWGPVINFLMS